MAKACLSPMYVELLKAISTSVEAQNDFTKKYAIRSMQMAAISSHLVRQGYILEKGIFQRKLVLTQKGQDAVSQYAA